MKGNVSIRRLLLSAVVLLVLAAAVDADPLIIVIGPGENTFRFQNGHDTATATDFHVGLIGSVPLPGGGIGGGSGGPPFPVTTLQDPAAIGGGFFNVTYDGGAGIAPGAIYTHSFIGWPEGTRFSVSFSYLIGGQRVFLDPVLIVANNIPQGETHPVPEPMTIILVITGLGAIAIRTRKSQGLGRVARYKNGFVSNKTKLTH